MTHDFHYLAQEVDPIAGEAERLREALSDLVAVIDENGIFDHDYPRVMQAARAALSAGSAGQ